MSGHAKSIVCLGGGIGTVNLIKGLKLYVDNITVVVSLADEGGSSGRLRRLYNMPPPGDLISCMSAYNTKNQLLSKLLTYRFPGNRYGSDESLGGHKLGNLIMAALYNLTGNLDESIKKFQDIFSIPGTFIPATSKKVSISAQTNEGKIIHGEETIDLGKYNGKRVLEKVMLHPKNAYVSPKVLESLRRSDCIIAGPGDLYTTVLPVLIVNSIAKFLKTTTIPKIFIVNVANKPFETRGYVLSDYILAVKNHLGTFPFDRVLVNNNFSPVIPKKYRYSYVEIDKIDTPTIIEDDLIDSSFPLYHSCEKLAKVVAKYI